MKISESERRRNKIANNLWGKKIKARRKRLHISQKELGRALRVGQVTIFQWEHGILSHLRNRNDILQKIQNIKPRTNGTHFGTGSRSKKIFYSKKQNDIFIHKLRKIRAQHNLSKAATGRILGFGRACVYNWENGISQPCMSWEKVFEILENNLSNPPDSP